MVDMGTGAIELLATSTDITAYVDQSTFSIESQANKLNGIADFVVRDETGALAGLLIERAELAVTDGGTRIYGGQIATLTPSLDGSAVEYRVKCQSFDCILDQRVIESGLRDRSGGSQYDDDDVAFIAAYASDLGLEWATYVSRIRTLALPSIDYSGLTLRQALDRLSGYTTGATYWVDENKKLHWRDPQTAQLVQNSDFESGSTHWSLDGSASMNVDGGPGGTGDEALTVTGTGTGTHQSTQTVSGITGSRRYMFFADLWASIASAGVITLDWQNSSSVSQRTDTLDNGATTSAWLRKKTIYTAPASATKVVVKLGVANNSTATAVFDNVNLIGEDAAWGVSTTPDGTITKRMWGWSQPTDAANPVNRVLIIGDGITGWREQAASIAYFGQKFEGVLNDARVTTTDGIDSRAQYVFRKYAFPAHSGKYTTDATGLVAGSWQIIEVEPVGLQAIEWIATITTTFDGASQMLYKVTYGSPSDDLGSVMASLGSVFSDSTGELNVSNPVIPGADTTAPATPTGLALSTSSKTAPDGTLRPYLLASWTGVGDVDLDAYELALDRAIEGEVTFTASASGTGGALPAGDYAVQVTGEGIYGGETAVSSPAQVVTISAGQRLYVNITAKAGCTTYKVYASILAGAETQPQDTTQTTTTTGSNVEVTAAGSGAVYPLTSSTAIAFINPTTRRFLDVSYYTEDVIGGVYYAVRVRAVDTSGNASGWTSPVGAVAALDTSAPSIPTGVSLSTGFRVIGVRWQANAEPDLAYYQVRWAPESTPGSGVPDTTAWDMLTTFTNWALVSDLDPGTTDGTSAPLVYFMQVRAVDRSGNTVTSATVSTAVDASANLDAGWSNDGTNEAYISASPILLSGQTDVAYGSILSEHIAATGIDAGKLTAGTLTLGAQPNSPDVLYVYDVDGNEIGRWDQYGLVIIDSTTTPPSPGSPTAKAVRVMGGVVEFSDTYNPYDPADAGTSWSTAISGDGIKADAITLGTAPGGHNAVPNASFELAAFATALSNGWEANSAWATTIGTDVNVTKNAGNLALTTYTY